MAATLGGAAVWYAERGHLVFPLRPGLKVPATPHGFKDATTHYDQVADWWANTPQANIGLATGHLFDVIDVDGLPGIESLSDLEHEGLVPESFGHVATPRGYHLYIRPTGDGCATALRPGLDYRGAGGYVVAPPSIVEGVTYRWLDAMSL